MRVSLDFKRYVFAATRRFANVHVVDLQAERAVTHDLDHYDDIYHYDPSINAWLVEATCLGRNRVTAGNVDQFEGQLAGQVSAIATPAGLAAVTGSVSDSAGEARR